MTFNPDRNPIRMTFPETGQRLEYTPSLSGIRRGFRNNVSFGQESVWFPHLNGLPLYWEGAAVIL
jgi:hypothetical protein